jgi:hypothetical protein
MGPNLLDMYVTNSRTYMIIALIIGNKSFNLYIYVPNNTTYLIIGLTTHHAYLIIGLIVDNTNLRLMDRVAAGGVGTI